METRHGTRMWRCGPRVLRLDRPLVMGIVNVTPDSFSDGGMHEDPVSAVRHAQRLLQEGAALLDVGGESTRPGATPIASSEELARVRPVIRRLADEGVPISVDTRRADVARACLDAGAGVVNDVSGFRDPCMVEAVVDRECGLVVMHMSGEPETMQDAPDYVDVVAEVGGFLLAQAAMLEAAGVSRDRIVIDPGIGFGKTFEHNLALLRSLPELTAYGYPVLVGVSRKRFIGEITGEAAPAKRLGGSVAAAIEAVRRGASVVRVHDVAETVQALAVAARLASPGGPGEVEEPQGE